MATRDKVNGNRVSAPPSGEIGATGVRLSGKVLYNTDDYNVNLQSQQGMIIYDKMRRSDAEISGGIARLTWPVGSAEWTWHPADVKGGEEHAAWCEEKLGKLLPDVVRQTSELAPTFGFMAWELVWVVDEDGDQVVRKIAARLPRSVREFHFENPEGELSSMVQYAWSPRDGNFARREIPAEKLAVCTFGLEGENLWGRSILRSAYPSWDMKRKILWVDAASLERFGLGVLELHATEEVTDVEKQEAETAAMQFRSHQSAYLFTPAKFEAKFWYPPSGQSRAIDSAKYHDQQEERSMLVEFMATGTAETGSRAVVSSKMDMLLLAEQGLAKIVERMIQQQITKRAVDANFGVQDDYPLYSCEDISKLAGTDLATMISTLKTANVIRYDRKLEEFVRQVMDLPDIDDATREEPTLPPQFGNGTNPPGQPDKVGVADGGTPPPGAKADSVPPKQDAAKAASLWGVDPSMPIPSNGLAREPMYHERFCAFSEYQKYLDSAPVRIWNSVVKGFRDQTIVLLSSEAASSSDSKNASKGYSFPLKKSFTAAMVNALMPVYGYGRKTVLAERDRQLAGTAYFPVPAKMAAAKKVVPPLDEEPQDDIQPTGSELNWVKTIAASFVGAVFGKLALEASRAVMTARNANRDTAGQIADVTSALHDMSEPVVQADLGGVTNRAFGNGRDEQAASMSSDVENEYYSAVLDTGTCDVCASMDGEEQGPNGDTFTTPNPNCEGGDRCRCVTIYVWRDAKEAA